MASKKRPGQRIKRTFSPRNLQGEGCRTKHHLDRSETSQYAPPPLPLVASAPSPSPSVIPPPLATHVPPFSPPPV